MPEKDIFPSLAGREEEKWGLHYQGLRKIYKEREKEEINFLWINSSVTIVVHLTKNVFYEDVLGQLVSYGYSQRLGNHDSKFMIEQSKGDNDTLPMKNLKGQQNRCIYQMAARQQT